MSCYHIPTPPAANSATLAPCPFIHSFWLYLMQIPDIRAFHVKMFVCISKRQGHFLT